MYVHHRSPEMLHREQRASPSYSWDHITYSKGKPGANCSWDDRVTPGAEIENRNLASKGFRHFPGSDDHAVVATSHRVVGVPVS